MPYQKPDAMTKNVVNPMIKFFTRLGLSMRGSRVLAVPGRKTGKIQTLPVNLLTYAGKRYLVAPRGETQWARNVRAAGGGELRLGRKRDKFRAIELPDAEKPPLLRAYLKLWKMETGRFFGGVNDESPEEEQQREASNHPVFRIEYA